MADKLRFTLCGSFGFGNAGDEAVPLAMADLAQAAGIDAEFDVLSRYDKSDLPHVIDLGGHDEERRARLRGQPLLFAGGGVIEARPFCVYWRCMHLAKTLGAPYTALFGASVEAGAAFSWRTRRGLRRRLRAANRLHVRDVLSAEALRGIVPKRPVTVVGDAVLWMAPAESALPQVKALGPFSAVTLSPRWAKEPGWHAWLAKQLANVAEALNCAIVFVPCAAGRDDDRIEHRNAARELALAAPQCEVVCIEEPLEPRQIAAVYKRSLLTVGMRLHACVIAHAQRTPIVGLAYHPKLIGFARTMGCERFFLPPMPEVLPQSEGAYGYALPDTGLTGCDLRAAALAAIEDASFDKLDEFRERLKAAFLELADLA